MFLKRFRSKIADLLQDQLYEAERAAIDHEAAAEHHAALSAMYKNRMRRIKADLAERAEPVGTSE